MKKLLTIISVVALLVASANESIAQCHDFAKKEALPLLDGYTPTGNLYVSTVEAGSTSSVKMILITGNTYRIVNKISGKLKDSSFQILDSSGNLIWDSQDHDYAQYWNFTVATTDEFTVRTIMAGSGSGQECSVIMVGFKMTE